MSQIQQRNYTSNSHGMKRRLLIAAALCILLFGVGFYLVPLFFSLPAALENPPQQGLVFEDRNGQPMRRLLDDEGLKIDEFALYGELPVSLINATVAAEDSRFFHHGGIDFIGIGRALLSAISEREFVSGASTITQQTIKISSPPRKRNIKTKILETFAARKLEIFRSKEQILAAYLNRLPYGNQFKGCRAAARGYFGKPLADLSVAEAAFLAGLPNKPTKFNPYRNLKGARKRQFLVLRRMKEEGYLSDSEFTVAMLEPLRILPKGSVAFHAPHFIDMIRQQQPDLIEKKRASGDSLKTTLDLALQQFVEASVTTELNRVAHRSGEDADFQAAVVVIDNASGDVLALTGSRSFYGSKSGQINGAWTPRSAGSTLKPFTYIMALEKGYTAASILADTPIEYVTSTGVYQPVNYDRLFHGPVTLRSALANSMNVPAVKLLNEIGGPKVLHGLLRNDLRFTSLTESEVEYGLGLTLGNAETRLLELTNAYACLARLGTYKPYRLSNDSTQPSLVEDHTLFNRDAAWLIADILSDNQARAGAFGLNSPLHFPFKVACKTGTSTDFRDNWTIGYTPDYTVGVWVGRFNNRPLKKLSGVMGAGPVFHSVMNHLYRKKKPTWYRDPSGLVRARIDLLNGKIVDGGIVKAKRTAREVFLTDNLAAKATAADYTSDGKTILPLNYTNWWRSDANQIQGAAKLRTLDNIGEVGGFRIISPLEGTVAFLDPDLPQGGKRFPLRIAGTGSESIFWESKSLKVESKNGRSWAILEPGEHRIIARDKKTGREMVTAFSVEQL